MEVRATLDVTIGKDSELVTMLLVICSTVENVGRIEEVIICEVEKAIGVDVATRNTVVENPEVGVNSAEVEVGKNTLVCRSSKLDDSTIDVSDMLSASRVVVNSSRVGSTELVAKTTELERLGLIVGTASVVEARMELLVCGKAMGREDEESSIVDTTSSVDETTVTVVGESNEIDEEVMILIPLPILVQKNYCCVNKNVLCIIIKLHRGIPSIGHS